MDDLAQRLQAAGVHTLLAQFTDVHGVAKGKYLPLEQLPELLTNGAGFAGPSIAGTGLPRTGPGSEYYARGDATTALALPWQPGVARLVCDGFVAGQPFDACPRQVLRRATARLAQRGWQLRTGIEPEFFLLRRQGMRFVPADELDQLDKPSYDLKSLARQRDFLRALHLALNAAELTVLQLDHEDAHGQFEVNFAFDDALASADHLMLFKQAAHTLAEERGLVFSMMPKPLADQPGSGLHFHVSMWQGAGDAARNLFAPGPTAGGAELSELGQHFAAGVLAHSAALCALGAPTVNSYKRLVVGKARSGTSWAPAFVAHGANNRTALVRTLPGRFEWRLPDASANPYLATAGLIAAGLDGIENKLPLPEAVSADLFTLPAAERERLGIPTLPQGLHAALDALERDAVVGQALGPVLLEQFVQLKREEATAYDRHVSDWEMQRYGDFF